MREAVEIDVAVLGGGIAGLWLLNRLRTLGYHATLIDAYPLGTGQTLAAQGIIHSGVKYTFDGVNRPQTESLSAMPKIWMDSIAGAGEVDLRGTEVLSSHQFMWSPGLLGRFIGAMASKAMRSDVGTVKRDEWPEVFQSGDFSGKVYRLEEPVLATRSVLDVLRNKFANFIHRGTVTAFRREENISEADVASEGRAPLTVRAKAFVFTAGTGNEFFAPQLGLDASKNTQRRPLRMFLARGLPHPLFAHCLVPEPKPRVTVTTHPFEGEHVWYIGGNVAEKAVGMGDAEALHWAQGEMRALFPWLDWSAVRWAIHDVDRAEPQSSKLLPSAPTLLPVGNAALAWPTKMAFAPALALKTLHWLQELRVEPSGRATTLPLPRAETGPYPWEEAQTWM